MRSGFDATLRKQSWSQCVLVFCVTVKTLKLSNTFPKSMSAATLVLSFRLNTCNTHGQMCDSLQVWWYTSIAGMRIGWRKPSLNYFSIINHDMSMVTPLQVMQSTCETKAMPCISTQCNYYETVQEALYSLHFFLQERRVAAIPLQFYDLPVMMGNCMGPWVLNRSTQWTQPKTAKELVNNASISVNRVLFMPNSSQRKHFRKQEKSTGNLRTF
jgi:hypothetical protein